MKYYFNEKEITKDEAHALKDKSGLIVSELTINFRKKEKGVKKSHRKTR